MNNGRKDISTFRRDKTASFDDIGQTIRGTQPNHSIHNVFVSTDRGTIAGDVIHATKGNQGQLGKDKNMLIGGAAGLLGSIGAMSLGYNKTHQHVVAPLMDKKTLAVEAAKDFACLAPISIGGQMIIDGVDKSNTGVTVGGATLVALGTYGTHHVIKGNPLFTTPAQRNYALAGALGTALVYPSLHTLSRASQNIDDRASIDSIVSDRNMEIKQKIRELAKVKNGVGARRAVPFLKYFGFTDKLEPIAEKLQHKLKGDGIYNIQEQDHKEIFDKLKNDEMNKAIQEFHNVKHRSPSSKEFAAIEKRIDSMIVQDMLG